MLNGDTAARGQWFRNNVPLTHSDKTRIAVNGRERQLTITDVQFEDTGNYEYRVNQDLTSANLTLNEGKQIDVSQNEFAKGNNNIIIIKCQLAIIEKLLVSININFRDDTVVKLPVSITGG